jgi:ATP synthase protein I
VLANYARIVRRSALLTGAVAVVMVAVSAVAGGMPGLIGGLLGVALTAAFFGIDLVTVGRAARVSPQAMMLAAIATYVFKILILAIVMVALEGTTAFSTRFLAITTIVCVIAWSAAQAITSMKLKTPYVDTGSAPIPRGGTGQCGHGGGRRRVQRAQGRVRGTGQRQPGARPPWRCCSGRSRNPVRRTWQGPVRRTWQGPVRRT